MTLGLLGKEHRHVRSAASAHMEKHEDELGPYFDEMAPEAEGKPFLVEGRKGLFKEYAVEMNKPGKWGGAIEVVSIARHYSRPVLVYQPDCAPQVGVQPQRSQAAGGGDVQGQALPRASRGFANE